MTDHGMSLNESSQTIFPVDLLAGIDRSDHSRVVMFVSDRFCSNICRLRMLLAILVISLLFVFVFSTAVQAAPEVKTVPVVEITESGTYLFTIGWDQGVIFTTLIAPDGSRIPQDQPTAGVTVACRGTVTIFRVEQAMTGTWQAECQQDNNGRVGVVVQRLIMPLRVENVIAAQIGGQDISIGFSLSGETDQACSWEAWLTTDGNLGNGKLIASGDAMTGQDILYTAILGGVSSFLKYQVVVQAECSTKGFTDFHQAVSPTFSYAAPNSPPPAENLAVVILPQGVEVSWSVPPDVEAEGFMLAAYLGSDELPWYAVRLDGSVRQAIIPASDAAATGVRPQTRIEVAILAGGLSGLPVSLTIDPPAGLEELLGCALPQNGSAVPGRFALSYHVDQPLELVTTLNDVKTKIVLQSSGELSLLLPDGLNHIRWQAKTSDQISVAAERMIYADSIAPILRIYEDPDGLKTSAERLLLAGNADDAVQVQVNGADVEKDTLNNFQVEIPLQLQDNRIDVTIADQAGNQVTYQAIVRRVMPKAPVPWILLVGLPVLIGLLAWYAVYGWRQRRRRS